MKTCVIMSATEVQERINSGESAESLAVEQWEKIRKLIIQRTIRTGSQLEQNLKKDTIILYCALCDKYTECNNCILPKADKGHACQDNGSAYTKVMQAADNESLILAVDNLLLLLKKAHYLTAGE